MLTNQRLAMTLNYVKKQKAANAPPKVIIFLV